jgi:hypothetical protein
MKNMRVYNVHGYSILSLLSGYSSQYLHEVSEFSLHGILDVATMAIALLLPFIQKDATACTAQQ